MPDRYVEEAEASASLIAARRRAEAWLAVAGNAPAMRSCWECNLAHEHLKRADYVFVCAAGCRCFFFEGTNLTAGP